LTNLRNTDLAESQPSSPRQPPSNLGRAMANSRPTLP